MLPVPLLLPACTAGAAILLVAGSSASLAGSPVGALDVEARVLDLATSIDRAWVLFAAALVLFMQVGFLMVEAGAVRTKNAVSVALKNLLDFAFAILAFITIGFSLAFGSETVLGLFAWGTPPLSMEAAGELDLSFFLFQAMFCGTAATIVSGAVAERMRLRAYVCVSFVLAAFLYPVFAHWAWGSALAHSPSAVLGNAHFVDFAGSTVVHSTGAWVALAAVLVIGSRKGRFDERRTVRFGGHSSVLSATGALILLVGWIGFNGGSTLALTSAVPAIILNTVAAGAAGAAAGFGLAWRKGPLAPERAINGMIGGLVAVTAGCHLVSPLGAILLGVLGSLAANRANLFIAQRLRLDDAVGAIGTHGVAGAVGTIGLAFVAPAASLPAGSRLDQALVQAAGVGLGFLWAFFGGLLILHVLKTVVRLRTTPEEEARGLNICEHGVHLGTGELESAITTLVSSPVTPDLRLPVEEGDDSQDLANCLNGLMDRLHAREAERRIASASEGQGGEIARFEALGTITADAILLIHDDIVRTANGAAEALFEAPADFLLGRSVSILSDMNGLPNLSTGFADVEETTREIDIMSDLGREVPVEITVRSTSLQDETVLIVRLTDISEKRAARDRIFHLAMHDPLTDLPNRELFRRRLDDVLATDIGRPSVALLLVDMDRFKDVNDIHGHPSGDTLLMAVAERLRAQVRQNDTVARLGGDEFAVIQTEVAFANQAADLAHRLLKALAEPLLLPSGATIHPRASIGIALAPRDGDDFASLMQHADLALYSAKQNGRNGYQAFEPGMGRALRLRQELESDLGLAIERGEFELFLQPRVDLTDARISSYEALIRWRRGDIYVSPADFIPVAEASGLVVPIGEWVIREACRIAASQFEETAISVNVSPRQFLDPGFLSVIRQALAETGLRPERLELEITEGVLIDDDSRAIHILGEIKALGALVSLDDFGTGYSSLSYLTRFRFDTIKLDRSFVQATDETAWHVIRSVLGIAGGLRARVVAEGVETTQQLERLMVVGCTEIQGFLVAEPRPVRDVPRKLDHRTRAMILDRRPSREPVLGEAII
ncbi:EAL domain-containing protein [Fulvimarina endophytica]|uniref:EAL domain-containing protein n=1 Tax=Fulvimarina endophytica TaxID=2293836 RepID=A0A371X274_9HYPH|nr:EAL domain-containing protein [Fulvimarina endophytica]RFC63332.1 EAL domain-containing protein [Fulvimarina endophytica]